MIQQHLHNYLASHRGTDLTLTIPLHDDARPNNKFRASDAGRCLLYCYHKRLGDWPAQAPDAETRLHLEHGNLLHAWILYALDDVGVLLDSERELENDHIVGHFDALVRDDITPDASRHLLYDFKTINGKKAFYKNKEGWKPDRTHVMQLHTYYSLLDAARQADISDLRIAYINRETLEIKEVEVPLTRPAYAETQAWWGVLLKAWNAQTPPAHTAEPWECRYCCFSKTCTDQR